MLKQHHKLRHNGFQCHIVGFNQLEIFFHLLSDTVNFHIGAFVHHLSRHDEDLSGLFPLVHLLIDGIQEGIGNSSYSEAFYHDAIIVFKQIRQKLRSCSGNQLKHTDRITDFREKANRLPLRNIGKITNDSPVLYSCKNGKIYALKGIEGTSLHLLRSRACNDISVKNKHYIFRILIHRIENTVP